MRCSLEIKPNMEFGQLRTIYSISGLGPHTVWVCECSCGSFVPRRAGDLRNGKSKSCGCLKKEKIRLLKTKHGMARSPEYSSWQSMHTRCTNAKSTKYSQYGGRGIKVCERWNSFENFFADMGARPHGTTLDRWPDTNGNYEPGNCRWATVHEQNNNKTTSLIGLVDGKTMTASEIAKKTGIPRETVRRHIHQGRIQKHENE